MSADHRREDQPTVSSNRLLVILGSLLLLISTTVSVALSAAYVVDEANRYRPLVIVTSAVVAVSGLFAGLGASRTRTSAMSIAVLVSAVLAVHAHAVTTSEALGIVGQPMVGWVGVVAGIALFVGVAFERIDGRVQPSRATTSN